MPVGEICNRVVIVANPDNTILEAAQLMRQHHVGSLVVVVQRDSSTVPVGIITDRDLVVDVMASEADQTVITVGDVMVPDLCTIKESAGLLEAIEYMRAKGVRRLPVVNQSGGLVGILVLDDLLELLAEELLSLSKLVRQEHKKETLARR